MTRQALSWIEAMGGEVLLLHVVPDLYLRGLDHLATIFVDEARLETAYEDLYAEAQQKLSTWLPYPENECCRMLVVVGQTADAIVEVAQAEGDVDTSSYEQGHIRGAVGWNWQTQLSDQVRRDLLTVEDGKVHSGEFSIDLPREGSADTTAAVAYARPHLLDIDHQLAERPQFRATIEHINAAGPLEKVELATETGTVVQVEMPQERYRPLGRRKGVAVFVRRTLCRSTVRPCCLRRR